MRPDPRDVTFALAARDNWVIGGVMKGLRKWLAVAVFAVAVAGCGSSSGSTTTTKQAAAAAKPKTTTTASSHSGLPGKWTGQYSGAYSGTFTLNWTQTGSKLSGNIQLSNPPETTGINGTVSGSTIKFGTVSGALYNGTVSGNSMSGNYTTTAGGGSWSAKKS